MSNKTLSILASSLRVILLAIGLLFAVIAVVISPAHAAPEEPPLSELHRWYPIQDGTVILEYRVINKDGVQLWRFKHAQKAGAEKAPSCNEIVVDGDEVHLLTQESKPSLYFIKKESDGFSPEVELDFTYDKW